MSGCHVQVPLLVPIAHVAAALPEAHRPYWLKQHLGTPVQSRLQSTNQSSPHQEVLSTADVEQHSAPAADCDCTPAAAACSQQLGLFLSTARTGTLPASGTSPPNQRLFDCSSKQQQQQQQLLPSATYASTWSATSTDGQHQPAFQPRRHQPSWSSALPSIALISMPGSGWASGIVLNKQGFILTNAHVIQPRHSSSTASDSAQRHSSHPHIRLRLSSAPAGGFTWCDAAVVYVFQHVLDVAVIRLSTCQPEVLQPAQLMSEAATAGEAVAVIGHALFSPDCQMEPSVTAGNITQVSPEPCPAGSSRGWAVMFSGHGMCHLPIPLRLARCNHTELLCQLLIVGLKRTLLVGSRLTGKQCLLNRRQV